MEVQSQPHMHEAEQEIMHRSCLCQACPGLLKLLTCIDYQNTIKQISPPTLALLIFQYLL